MKEDDTQKPAPQGSQAPPPRPISEENQHHPPGEEQRQGESAKAEGPFQKMEARAAVALVFITFVYTIFTGIIMCAIHAQTNAAVRAVNTANETLQTTRTEFTQDQRPWVLASIEWT